MLIFHDVDKKLKSYCAIYNLNKISIPGIPGWDDISRNKFPTILKMLISISNIKFLVNLIYDIIYKLFTYSSFSLELYFKINK